MLTTNINFPDSLPGPLRENHSLQPAPTFEGTTMASGRTRYRSTFEFVPTRGNWEYLFDSGEAMAFEAWFRDELRDGAEWFNAKRKTPMGVIDLVCHFTAMYSGPTLFGVSHWRYTCPIEIIERPILPPGWGAFPGLVAGASIIDLAANREWPRA